MKELHGIAASPGISIGKVLIYAEDDINVPQYEISEDEIPSEMKRYSIAMEKAIAELESLKFISGEENDPDGFIDTHILMLQDPEVLSRVKIKINKVRMNVEWVLMEVIDELASKLNSMKDTYMRERALDIRDVSQRVLNHLMALEKRSLADIKDEVILVTTTLMPSDAVAMNKRAILGIAMDAGGTTTHTAILARSFEIPAVLGMGRVTKEVKNGDLVILDGSAGLLLVNPDEETLKSYQNKQRDYEKYQSQLLMLNSLKAETRDGKSLHLMANIEMPEELDSVLAHGADGVGLYRSEFLFIKNGVDVPEDLQYEAYKRVLEGMTGQPVVIRTLDLGGDKLLPEMNNIKETNPILGWRAIRFCLNHKKIFRTQLRALLRASVHGDLRIMFPLISGVDELDQAYQILEEVRDELRSKEIQFKEKILIGTMIEVPSAAICSDILATKVDFFSVGTNDLTQYTLAVDRGNEKIAHLYQPYHPAVLRLIRLVVQNAHKQGIPVEMCGELAGDPFATVVLLGLGIDVFSMSSFSIPRVKQILRGIRFSEAEEIAGKVLEMRGPMEIEQYLRSYLKGRFEEIESQ